MQLSNEPPMDLDTRTVSFGLRHFYIDMHWS